MLRTSRKPLLSGTFASWRGALLALLAAPCALFADVDWSAYRKSFDITFPGYAGTETLTDFPVLVRLSAARNDFDYSKCILSNGGDLRFSDAEGNLLASEVDTWDENGESLVWVKVPSFNADTIITAHYGCASPATVTASDVWSNGYLGVWHLNGSASPLPSSTAGGLSFTRQNSHSDFVALGQDGIVGGSAEFDVVTEGDDAHKGYLSISDKNKTLTGLKTMTIEMWVNQREYVNGRRLLYRKTGNDRAFDYLLGISSSLGKGFLQCTFGTTNTTEEVAQADVTPTFYFTEEEAVGAWRHVSLVFDSVDSKTATAFVNGASANSRSVNEDYVILPTGDDIKLGNLGGNQAFPGRVDEMRISGVARSADWVEATFDTVNHADFAVASMANDWKRYSHSFSVSFPGAPATTLADFPVLVKLSEGSPTGFSYADCLKENGDDLRFADADGNLLDSEVDTWDTNGVSSVWVKVPYLSSSAAIRGYYGWVFAPAVAGTNVWSNGYLGVWHLGETARPLKDSGANSLDFTAATSWANRNKESKWDEYDACNRYGAVGGAVGGAVTFDASVNSNKGGIIAPDDTGIIGGLDAISVEIWAKCADTAFPSTSQYLLSKRRTSTNPKYRPFHAYYGKSNGAKLLVYIGLDDSEANDGAYTANTDVKPHSGTMDASLAGEWNYHVFQYGRAMTYSTNYLNGAYSGRASSTTGYPVLPGFYGDEYYALCLGNNGAPGTANVFDGSIDELRISNVARSDAWVKATYDTIKGNAAFTRYGQAAPQTKPTMVIFR